MCVGIVGYWRLKTKGWNHLRTNYVLIDYENVQPDTLAVLDKEHFKVIVFIGANQAKIPFELVSAIQRMGDRAEYIKIAGNGPNTLDFHIAFYIGQLATQEPQACFHIISKDTGFDPLIQHLKDRKILACRARGVADIAIVKAADSKSPDEKLSLILMNLQQRGAGRPRTVKSLSNTINSLFQGQLSEQELLSLLGELQKRSVVTIHDTRVSYAFPA